MQGIFSAARWARRARWGMAAMLAVLALPSWADLYRYQYTGNLWTMTTQLSDWPLGHPTQGRSFSLQAISAEFTTATPIEAGLDVSDVTGFSMTISPGAGPHSSMTYPFVRPPCPGCPPLDVTGGLSIGEVSFQGLPSAWSMWISSDETYPTGRHQRLLLSSTSVFDHVEGGYEGFVSYSGGLMQSPGVWTVTLVAPEPSTYALMAIGLLVMGTAARRRWRGRD